MTQEAALDELKRPAYNPETIHHDFEYVASKLDMTVDELQACFDAPNRTYMDYSNQEALYNIGAKAMKMLGKELGGKR